MTSHATTGATAMRTAVIALGRFTWTAVRWASRRGECGRSLGERLQHQLADRFQRVEYPVSADGDSLEVCRALDPFARWNLFDEVLASVIRVRRHSLPCGVTHFPTRVELRLEVADRRGVRQ